MLKIFNDLGSFFKDNYRRINVREYARIRGISPPSASTLLQKLEKEGLLIREDERNYTYYAANKESGLFIDLSRAYWRQIFEKSGLVTYLEKELAKPTIILFGSFSKGEVKEGSDIDLAIFTPTHKQLDFQAFQKKLGRKIQLFTFKAREEVKSRELLNNILAGYILSGDW